jgi:Zn finger protein HypA/HybF involved in hydrogenase expression
MEESNVIEFSFDKDQHPSQVFVENKKEPQYADCKHARLSIDQSTDTVWCKDCGQKLSPMWVLNRIADKHNRFYWNYSEVFEKSKKAQQMNRCKCQHCGQMTRIVKG